MLNQELGAVGLILDVLGDYRIFSNRRSCVRAYEHPIRARQELQQSA
jgi:hypothetical protein